MDRVTGQLYVLEVNANCGISSDHQTSTGQILMLTGTPFHELLADILSGARDTKL
jgi:D-alanine-D-alanine ligase